MKRIAFFFLALLVLLHPARAEGDDIAFAVPGPGRITLGVFDKAGKLVRTLHAMDGEEAFRIGLNGYITRWDGLDDAGNKAPSGHYHIRGYLIEDVTVEGEAYHFNDWTTDEEDPSLRHIVDFAFLPEGDVLLLAISADGLLLATRYSTESGFVWVRQIGTGPATDTTSLAANSNTAIIMHAGNWHLLDLQTGTPSSPPIPLHSETPRSIAALPSKLFGSLEKAVVPFSLPGMEPQPSIDSPVALTSLDADNGTLVGSGNGRAWISEDMRTFHDIPISAQSVSLGTGKTLWFVSADGSDAVGQANFKGDILRELHHESDSPRPKKIHASRTSETFAVLETSSDSERLRVFSRGSGGDWTVDWEKTIRESKSFGYVNGEVSPSVQDAPQTDSLRFRLEENPLTGERQDLNLRVVFDDKGTRLSTPDGLPIVSVSRRSGIRRAVIRRGQKTNSIYLLQGDGATVEEFRIQGLEKIIPLNAGGIELN